MIALNFQGALTPHAAGPAPYFQLDGETMRQGPDGAVIATYANQQWQVGDTYYTGSEVNAPVLVRLVDAAGDRSHTIGPFPQIRTADGVLYAGQEAIAQLDPVSGQWHLSRDGGEYPCLVIEEVEPLGA